MRSSFELICRNYFPNFHTQCIICCLHCKSSIFKSRAYFHVSLRRGEYLIIIFFSLLFCRELFSIVKLTKSSTSILKWNIKMHVCFKCKPSMIFFVAFVSCVFASTKSTLYTYNVGTITHLIFWKIDVILWIHHCREYSWNDNDQ